MGVLRRSPNVLYDLLDERAVLIDAQGTELITLNRVGTVVWQALDGERSPVQIADELAGLFEDVDRRRISTDVEAFLDELRRLGLVAEASDAA